MSRSHALSCFVVAAALFASACSSDTSEALEVTLELEVVEFGTSLPYPPVEGATVCLLGTDDCAETNASGVATLAVPGESELALTVTKDDYFSALSAQTIGPEDLRAQTVILTVTLAETLGAVVDTPFPPEGTGVLSISALDTPDIGGENGIAGATFAIMDSEGKQYYFEGQVPSLDAEETTTPLGSGGWVELPPGEYDVELGGTAVDCEVLYGWDGSAAGTTLAPVEEGHSTFVYLICEG